MSIRNKNERFECLFALYREDVYIYCCKRMNESDAEDCTQEVFLRLYEGLQSLTNKDVRTWLYVAAEKVCAEYLLNKKRMRLDGGTDIETVVESDFVGFAETYIAIYGMPEEFVRLFEDLYIYGLNLSDMCRKYKRNKKLLLSDIELLNTKLLSIFAT